MRYGKRRSQTSLTLEYGVDLLMFRNMIQISWSQGLSCINLWNIQNETIGYHFYCPEEQSIFVTKRAIFSENEYLLRRYSGSKVVLQKVLDLNTNTTSLDENSVPENLQVHTEAPRRTGGVPRQPDRYVGHIVTDDVDTLHLKDNDPLTYS